MKTLEGMSVDEYEAAIDRFIEKAAQWDGSLPAETFFATWKALESRKSPVVIFPLHHPPSPARVI